MKKITLLMWLKNTGNYLDYLKKTLLELENNYKNKINFEFFFYENNSNDNTKVKLIELQDSLESETTFFICKLNNIKKYNNNISMERGKQVRNMRNRLKNMIGQLDSDYVLIFDDDTYFNINIIENLINEMTDEIKMVIANGIMFDLLLELNVEHHYDTLAFTSVDNIGYKETGNTCLFKNCSRCFNKREKLNVDLDNKYLLDMNDDLIEIKSGFGNFALIDATIFNKISWNHPKINEDVLEWPSLCKNILDMNKKIVLSNKNKVLVCSKKYDYDNYKDIIINKLSKYK